MAKAGDVKVGSKLRLRSEHEVIAVDPIPDKGDDMAVRVRIGRTAQLWLTAEELEAAEVVADA